MIPARHDMNYTICVVLILCVFVLLVLAISNGVYSNTQQRLGSLNVYVVNFDARLDPYLGNDSLVGDTVINVAESIAKSGRPHVGYTTMDPSIFNHDPMKVRQAVYDFKAYAAIIVNANATALLRQAVEVGNTSYDPYGAGQVIYVSARDQTTIPAFVVPQLNSFESAIANHFGTSWAQSLLQNDSVPRSTLEMVPQALSPAIGFTTFDLRPFGPSLITPAVSIHLINLIIIAFFSFTFFLKTHMKFTVPRGHPPLHFRHLIVWRWCATVAAYFLLSLAFSVVVLAYQVPTSNPPAPQTEPAMNPSAYGRGTFVVYWMLNFVGMAALGLACENVAMALGEPWTAMWIIFWVTTNVSTAFNSLDLAPKFYKWGYAFPLHNIVEASHQIFFDLHSRIGRNFGVLFAWATVNTIVFPFACYLMRWKQVREYKLKQEKKERWLQEMAKSRTILGMAKEQ